MTQGWKIPKMARTADLKCPLPDCHRTCGGMQGLSAHIRANHPQHYRAYGTDPAPPVVVAVTASPVAAPRDGETLEGEIRVYDVPVPTPFELLDQAIRGLVERQGVLDIEIGRMTALVAEKEELARRLAALQTARGVFMTAEGSRDAG